MPCGASSMETLVRDSGRLRRLSSIYYLLLLHVLFFLNSKKATSRRLRPGKDVRKHITYRGSFWSKNKCVRNDLCNQRCFAYVSNVARGINSIPGEGFPHTSLSVKEHIVRDAHICFLGCCFRSGVDYQKCSDACHKYSYVHERTIQFRQYHICTKGCFARCPSMSHEAEDSMLTIAPMDSAGCTTKAPTLWGRSTDRILPTVKQFQNYVNNADQKLVSQLGNA